MDIVTRKRMRIERIKKKAAKNMTNQLDDPSQPDWVKIKNLREVATVREAATQKIVSQAMGAYFNENQVIHLIPGQISFFTLTLTNDGYDDIQ